jgi:hypothetical protein
MLGAYADLNQLSVVCDNRKLYLRLDTLDSLDYSEADYTVYLDIDQDAGTGSLSISPR